MQEQNSWCSLRLLVPAVCYDEVLGIVWQWEGTEGVEEREEPGFVALTVHVRKTESLDADIETLRLRTDLYRQFSLRDQPLENWMANFHAFFKPLAIANKLRIVPEVQKISDPHLVDIVIEPGLGFGTGHHETTYLCLEALVSMAPLPSTFLDVGSGSGILSIAAVKCGCERAHGVEIDEDANANARENAEKNGVAESVFVSTATIGEVVTRQGRFPLVVANMLLKEQLPLYPELLSSMTEGGKLILCGFLRDEIPKLEAAIAPELQLCEERFMNDWGIRVYQRIS